MVDAAHEGVAATSANRPSAGPLRRGAPPRRSRPGPAAAPRSPRGGVARRPGRGPPASRDAVAALRLGDDDERRVVRQGAPALREQREQRVEGKAIDHPAQHDAPERVRPARPARYSDASPMVTERPRSRAPRATAPRGSTPCAAAPAPASAGEEPTLPAVGVHDVATGRARQHVRGDRPDPVAELAGRDQPRGALHRPVLRGEPRLERGDAGREEAERLDHVAHRLLELGLLALGGPRRAVPRPGAAGRGDPAAGRAARLLGPQRVRQRGGAGVVRAVAIAEMRERRQEVPRIAPLGRQAGERLPQGLGRPGLVLAARARRRGPRRPS